MNSLKLSYFEKEDILHSVILDDPESISIEIIPNITAELNEKDELVGVEIVGASSFLRDAILESVEVRLLQLLKKLLDSEKAEHKLRELKAERVAAAERRSEEWIKARRALATVIERANPTECERVAQELEHAPGSLARGASGGGRRLA